MSFEPASRAAPPLEGAAGVLLVFDTSTERLAVGLSTPWGQWHAEQAGGAAASAALLPCIDGLLDRAGVRMGQLQAIGFGCGPGAFTGLRTSCAVAQGLGFGLGCPLLPIDSLLIVAEDARAQVAPEAAEFDVGVAVDARMGEVYAARYRWHAARWQVVQPPVLSTPARLREQWRAAPPAWLVGSAVTAFGEVLQGLAGASLAGERDRARALLRLAAQALQAGLAIAPSQALPLYLRDKVALTTREREALRAGAPA